MTQKLKTYGWVSFIFSFWWSFYINLMVHHHKISLPLFIVRNVYATAQCQESAIRNLSANAQCQESLCQCSVSGISLPMLSVRNLPSGISATAQCQESLCHYSVSGISLPLFSVRNLSAIVQCCNVFMPLSIAKTLAYQCWIVDCRISLFIMDYETMSTFSE